VWTFCAARPATVSGARPAAGVRNSAAPREPARSAAARPSGKFSPEARTALELVANFDNPARRAVSYLFTPAIWLLVTADAEMAVVVSATASPETASALAATPAARDFENRFTEVLKGDPPGRWLLGPGRYPGQ